MTDRGLDAGGRAPAPRGSQSRGPRNAGQYALAVAIGLAGAGAVAVAVGKPWFAASASVPGLPRVTATASGSDLVPLAGAAGFVLLGAYAAVIATRGRLRRIVGGLVVGAALVVAWASIAPPDVPAALAAALAEQGVPSRAPEPRSVAWRWLALAGAVGCVASGIGTAARGHRWPGMASRYDAPAARTGSRPTPPGPPAGSDDAEPEALWAQIDDGHDPTRRGPGEATH